jgi:acetyl-CoA carboxylase beta subunit
LLSAVKVEVVQIPTSVAANTYQDIVWVAHNFGFLGGSLGCAEGEKITRAFELALEKKLPIVVQCRSGGARMQEGTSSLMQMAKVAVAVQAAHDAGIPFISVLSDPTYGGVSASYAMQADVRIAVAEVEEKEDGSKGKVSEARIGFAGPQVILNTMCEANQAVFDQKCPTDFQAASFVYNSGQVDMVLSVPAGKTAQNAIERKVADIAHLLIKKSTVDNSSLLKNIPAQSQSFLNEVPEDEKKAAENFNYTRSRLIDRPQTQDIIKNVFESFIELRCVLI